MGSGCLAVLAAGGAGPVVWSPREVIPMSAASTVLLPFQPVSMATAQLAAVSFLARYSGRTHQMYTAQSARWFAWCEGNGLDSLRGIKRAHVELDIRHLGDCGLMDSSIVT